MATDLPEPVVPAISKCGMRDKSTMTDSPPMVLPRQSGNFAVVFVVVVAGEQFAQVNLLARRVWQLDADCVAARYHGDARRYRAHRAGDVVGKADHARRFDARRRFKFIERDHRTGPRIDDFAAYAEILQHAFKRYRVSVDYFARQSRALAGALRGQEIKRRQHVAATGAAGGYASCCALRAELASCVVSSSVIVVAWR